MTSGKRLTDDSPIRYASRCGDRPDNGDPDTRGSTDTAILSAMLNADVNSGIHDKHRCGMNPFRLTVVMYSITINTFKSSKSTITNLTTPKPSSNKQMVSPPSIRTSATVKRLKELMLGSNLDDIKGYLSGNLVHPMWGTCSRRLSSSDDVSINETIHDKRQSFRLRHYQHQF